MENNNKLIKKINGLKARRIDCEHPIDNFHFIEFIDENDALRISFSLYYFKGIYYDLMFKEYFKPKKVLLCKKLSDYTQTYNKFISISEAKQLENKYFEDFILQTQFLKKLKSEKVKNENNV